MPVRSSATPPWTGSTWPSSELPAPNGITGTPCSEQVAQDRGDLLGRVRERDGVGLARGEARLVAAVQPEDRGRRREALAEQVAQRARGRVVHRAAASSSATTPGPVIGPRWPTPTILRAQRGEPADALARLLRVQVVGLVRDVGGGRAAGHRRQVDRVAHQRDAVGLPPQADLARRVAGQLDHLEARDPLARRSRCPRSSRARRPR